MNIFSTKGRIGRGTYFLWMLAIGFLMAGISFLPFPFLQEPNVSYALGLIIGFVCIFPSVRRLHDLNRSGWFWLCGLIPIVNVFLGLFLLFVKGTEGSNDYGESPNNPHAENRATGEKCFVEPDVAGAAPAVSSSLEMNDDDFYDQVAEEIETNSLIPGVWTRAFAEADGDENRAKAIYIKLRVAKLAEEKYLAEKKHSEDLLEPEEKEFREWQAKEKELKFVGKDVPEQSEELTVQGKVVTSIVIAVILIVIVIAGVYSATSH